MTIWEGSLGRTNVRQLQHCVIKPESYAYIAQQHGRTTSMGTMTDCVARLATAPPTPLLTAAVWAAVSCARSQNLRHAAFTISNVVR